MNSVNIIGRLVEDPDLRFTPNGAAVANCRIAVNNAGAFISEKEEYKAGFFNVVVWGKTAESLSDYCGKGRELAIQGRLSQRDWDDDNEQRHYVTEIIAERIDFLREPGGASESNEPNGNGKPKDKDNAKDKAKGGNNGRGNNNRGGQSRGR